MGTVAQPNCTGAAAVTLTPRLLEMLDVPCDTRALAALWTAAALAAAALVLSLPAGASGMVRMAATLTLPAENRTVR